MVSVIFVDIVLTAAKKELSATMYEIGEMMKYRKKPVVIDAVQLVDGCSTDMEKHIGFETPVRIGNDGKMFMLIQTLEGEMKAEQYDYIIKGVQGEFYPCKPDIFEQTYEKVNVMTKLKRCPFCGEKAYFYNQEQDRIMHKEDCYLKDDTILNINEQNKSWNKRVKLKCGKEDICQDSVT